MAGLGFYRIVPLLLKEAKLTEMAVRAGDLERANRARNGRKDAALEELWDRYLDHDLTTSGFLRACANLYGVRA